MKMILRMFLIIALLSPSLLWAEETSDLRKEIEELKYRLEVIEATDKEVDDKFSRLFTLSGYADSEYIIDDRGGKHDGFRTHHLSFNFIKHISEKWRLFSEVEFEDSPKLGEAETQTITDSGGNTHEVEATDNKEGKLFV